MSFTRLSALRHMRRAAASSLTTIPVSTSVIGLRGFSSFINKLSDSVTSKVSQLADDVWLPDEKLVTEPRRKIEPQHALTQSLAERLAAQRDVRQRLVPTNIKVDKTRQYVEFTWPAEAAQVMEKAFREAATAANAAAHSTAATTSEDSSVSAAPTSSSSSLPSPATSPLPSSSSSSSSSTPSTMPLRTRALAEYLRAYTPSTDGALGAKDIVIYGRRGITITKVIPIGNYALRFVFSDDHTGGIYTYEYLYYLTGPLTKYGLMRSYIRELRRKRKSRLPPKRAPSKRVPRSPSGSDSHKH